MCAVIEFGGGIIEIAVVLRIVGICLLPPAPLHLYPFLCTANDNNPDVIRYHAEVFVVHTMSVLCKERTEFFVGVEKLYSTVYWRDSECNHNQSTIVKMRRPCTTQSAKSFGLDRATQMKALTYVVLSML